MQQPTLRDEIIEIKTHLLYIREQLDTQKDLEKRVSRLEQLGAAVTAIFAAAGFYFQNLIHK